MIGFRGVIGLGWTEITPTQPVRVRNWGASLHQVSSGVHQPLRAMCLTLQATPDATPLVLLALDLGWWRAPEHEWRIRGPVLARCGLPSTHLMLHLTHTHAGPSTHPDELDEPGGRAVAEWLASLPDTLGELVERTVCGASPAFLQWAGGTCGLAFARDLPMESDGRSRWVVGPRPEVGCDRTLLVGRVSSPSGAQLGTILNYACHPTSLGWGNALLSPDYLGSARAVVEAATGAPCLFLQGMSGDLAPLHGYARDPEVAESNGRQVGYAALSVLESIPGTPSAWVYGEVVESGAPIQAAWPQPAEAGAELLAEQVRIPVETHAMPSQAELEQAIRDSAGDHASVERLRRALTSLSARRHLAEDGMDAWVWRVGESWFVGLPCEAYSAMQARLRQGRTQPVVCMNIVNGWYAYLVDRFEPDDDRYAVRVSHVVPGAFDQVAARLRVAMDPESEPADDSRGTKPTVQSPGLTVP